MECVICRYNCGDNPIKEPPRKQIRLQVCNHSFCLKCIEAYIASRKKCGVEPRCPLCNMIITGFKPDTCRSMFLCVGVSIIATILICLVFYMWPINPRNDRQFTCDRPSIHFEMPICEQGAFSLASQKERVRIEKTPAPRASTTEDAQLEAEFLETIYKRMLSSERIRLAGYLLEYLPKHLLENKAADFYVRSNIFEIMKAEDSWTINTLVKFKNSESRWIEYGRMIRWQKIFDKSNDNLHVIQEDALAHINEPRVCQTLAKELYAMGYAATCGETRVTIPGELEIGIALKIEIL